MKSVAIIGPNGQLGCDLVRQFDAEGWQVSAGHHGVVSVEDSRSVQEFLASARADVVINTAAFHQVAACEREVARSWAVNALGARNVAEAAAGVGAVAVFISTDYVFDGTLGEDQSYPEDAPVAPINVYGSSKAAGELATLATADRNLVVRISSVFGAAGSSGKGGNFVETIIRKAHSGEPITVVDDIRMSPSYTVDVATKIDGLLESGATGVFHASNGGRATWHEFAVEICRHVGADVPVGTGVTDFATIPRRPANSSLSTAKLDVMGIPQRSWQEALADYLREKGHTG